MFCPNCGVENPDNAAECRRCRVPFHDEPAAEEAPHGEANSAGTICSRCETFNEPGVDRCTTCGYPLKPLASDPPPAAHAEPEIHAEPEHPAEPERHDEPSAHAEPERHPAADDAPATLDHTPEDPHPIGVEIDDSPAPYVEPHVDDDAGSTHMLKPVSIQDTPHEGSPPIMHEGGPSIAEELSALELSAADARAARGEDATPADGMPMLAQTADHDPAPVVARLAEAKEEPKVAAPPPAATPSPAKTSAPGVYGSAATFSSSPGKSGSSPGRIPLPAPSAPPPAAGAAPAEKTCASCGQVNLPNAKFCAECGTPFPKQAAPSAPPPSTAEFAPISISPATAPAPRPASSAPPSIIIHEDLHAEINAHQEAQADAHADGHTGEDLHAAIAAAAESAASEEDAHPAFDANKTDQSAASGEDAESTSEQARVVPGEERQEEHEDEHAEAPHDPEVFSVSVESVDVAASHETPQGQDSVEAFAVQALEAEGHAPVAPEEEPAAEPHEEELAEAPQEEDEAPHEEDAAPEEEAHDELGEEAPAEPEVQAAPPEPAPYPVTLVVDSGDLQGTAFHVTAMESSIGSAGAAIELEGDTYLAAHQATLYFEDQRLMLRDEGAVNGVYLKLRIAAALEPGDHFIAGQRLLRFDGPVELAPADAEHPFQGAPRPDGTTVRVVELLAGGKEGRSCHRAGPVIAVGKTGCDMNFGSDELLAARHAEIHLAEDGSASLVDLGAAPSGVLLRLRQGAMVELQEGDVVQLGGQTLRVQME